MRFKSQTGQIGVENAGWLSKQAGHAVFMPAGQLIQATGLSGLGCAVFSKNLFNLQRIEAKILDLIRLLFTCFMFFAYLICLLHLLPFASKYLLQFASKYSFRSKFTICSLQFAFFSSEYSLRSIMTSLSFLSAYLILNY